jgi:M6 family metalloprotease-like protein
MYRPTFAAGGEVAIDTADGPQACVDQALTKAGNSAHGVLVVADAEHNATQPGGFASAGECQNPPCNAATSRRFAYVGAADFSPDWGDKPPMDLIEHELGHALGWPHSGYDAADETPHESALDVMSDSAAPRDVHPDRRDAPDTLAVNRLAVGWLPTSAMAVVPPAGSTVTLSPSTGTAGTRVAVVALDDHRFLTIELLTADGFDEHLPASGVAVHLVDTSAAERTQTPMVGQAPFANLLRPGQTFSALNWSIAVDDGWRVTVHPLVDAMSTVSS